MRRNRRGKPTSTGLLGVAAALALAGAMAGASAALPPDQFYAKAAPSVWRVFIFDATGAPIGQGSAVVIAKETLLTNCHVLAKAKAAVIKRDNVIYEVRLQYADPARDLCQITARNLPAPAVEIGNSDRLTVGQRVYALGNPQGLELTLSDGLLSGLRKDQNGDLMLVQISAPISPGSSGGGLFDEEGRLIGITTSIIQGAQNLGFAIPINWLRDLAARSALADKVHAKLTGGRAESAFARAELPAPAAPR
ncbi:S1C family serine protease, partial [Massilia horti]